MAVVTATATRKRVLYVMSRQLKNRRKTIFIERLAERLLKKPQRKRISQNLRYYVSTS